MPPPRSDAWAGAVEDGDAGEREVIVLLAAKTMVGELELMSPDKTRNAAVTATCTVQGYEISFKALMDLAKRDINLGFKIMSNIARITCIRLRRMNDIYADASAALQLYANAYTRNKKSSSSSASTSAAAAPRASSFSSLPR